MSRQVLAARVRNSRTYAVHNSTLMYNESVRIFSRMQELAFPRRKGILAPVSVLVLLILPLVDLPSANGESPTNRSSVCLRANTYIHARSSSVRVVRSPSSIMREQ